MKHVYPVLGKESARFVGNRATFECPNSCLTRSTSAYRAPFSPSLAVAPATYVNTWSGYVEGGMYILAAIVLVTAAYYAVVELR